MVATRKKLWGREEEKDYTKDVCQSSEYSCGCFPLTHETRHLPKSVIFSLSSRNGRYYSRNRPTSPFTPPLKVETTISPNCNPTTSESTFCPPEDHPHGVCQLPALTLFILFPWSFILPLPLCFMETPLVFLLSASLLAWKQNNAAFDIFGSVFTLCWHERRLRGLHLPLVVLRPGPAAGVASAGQAGVWEGTLGVGPRQTAQTRWKGSRRGSGVRGMLGRNREWRTGQINSWLQSRLPSPVRRYLALQALGLPSL